MGKNARSVERAARKRRDRETKVKAEKVRRRTAQEAIAMRSRQIRAGDLPLYECVVSKGWSNSGLAHILVARQEPDGNLVVGGYYVDTLCVGLKDTVVVRGVTKKEYEERVKPDIFKDLVEFETCDPGVAKAIVEGAISFAERVGFRPNKRWEESKAIFDGIDARPEGLSFGRGGKPCLVVRKGDSVNAALRKLDRVAGRGNYTVVGEVSEEEETESRGH